MDIKIKKKPPMPWYQKSFYILSFVFLISAFIYLGTKNYNSPKRKLTDAESFTQEYGITEDNVYVYKSARDILELLNTGTGIVFCGFPENDWSRVYAEVLNDVAKRFDVTQIWYYNFKNDRSNNNHYYNNIVKQLEAYTFFLDNNQSNLYAPTVFFVKDGEIVAYDDETAIMKGNATVDNYWTVDKLNQKTIELGSLFQKYLGEIS